jgi:hypothetical protein
VTKVTAFSSGVAYYENGGKITDEAQVQLSFKADQINDILKSLVIMDLSGGSVSGITYASQEPISHALKSFGIDISGNPPLNKLLEEVRGAQVTLMTPEKLAGKVVSVERRKRQILPANVLIEEDVLNILMSDGLKAIPLDTIKSIALSDEKLTDELNKALNLLIESRDTTRKPVQITFAGKGERTVRVGYINEAPIWRTSYRLVLGQEEKPAAPAPAPKDAKAAPDAKGPSELKPLPTQPAGAGKAGKAIRMQGWAIIDNTGEADWDKVDLTLVSGRPISFVQDLYTPLFLNRPVVVPELYASLRPPVYEEGLARESKDLAELEQQRPADRKRDEALKKAKEEASAAAVPAGGAGLAGRRMAAAPAAKPAEDLAWREMQALQQGQQAVAAAGSVGELFSYHIQTPVTLGRRKSAMLPIVNQGVAGRKVSIYNQSVLAKNPLNGLWLINDTELNLMGGPVTVFDGGTYAGDARIDNLSPGDKRLLSYAIDLDVVVDPTDQTTAKIASAKIVRGVVTFTYRTEYTHVYAVKNKAQQAKVLVIEHPRAQARKLIRPEEPNEKTPAVYRFEVEIQAAKDDKPAQGTFTVLEEQISFQSIQILPADVGTLQIYATNQEIPQKVRDALAEAAKRKGELTLAERKLGEIQNDITAKRQEQTQVRQNMVAMERGSAAYQRFEKKVLDLETEIEKLQKDTEAQRTKASDLRKALEDYINGMNVE